MNRKSIIWGAFIGVFWSLHAWSAAAPPLPDLLNAIASGTESEKVKAINRLEELGVANEAAVAVLTSQLQSDSAAVRAHAVHALGALKAAGSTQAVLPLAFDKNAEVRQAAIFALRELKPGPQLTVPILDRILQDADPKVRMQVLSLVAEVGKPAVPALMKLLDQEESALWGCSALGAIGPDAAAAVPAVTKLLGADHPPKLRLEAAMALSSIGPAAAAALPELTAILDQKDPVVLPGAIFAVGRLGPAGKSSEKKLHELAAEEEPFTRVIATWALCKLNPDNQKLLADSLPALVAALIDKEPRTRAAATKCLVDLKSRPSLLMPLVEKFAEGANSASMENIVEVVAEVGAPAVPVLVKALAEPPLRARVAAILGRLGPDARKAAPALAEVLGQDKSPAVRREALIALGAIGPFAAEQSSAIAKVLKDDDSQLRAAACYALGKIGPLAIGSKNDLLECLKSDDELCRMAAAWALTRVDPNCPEGSRESVPCLVKELFNADPHIRMEAVAALQALGPQAREAIPALKKVADDDPLAPIRLAADEAIKAVAK
ncbi:MAG: HEAT repeat domain-containing protein [Pirellulales bacterium]|nr:HEAT repeat domain-containing protein [Pirellulales bacterium]